MAENAATLRLKKDEAETSYDAAVTALNRCQAQLSSKAAQAQKLPPDEYRTWLDGKKSEQFELTVELQRRKKVRAEARRQFNSWQPEVKEEWIEWPDCEGWWWNNDNGIMRIFYFSESADNGIDFDVFCGDGLSDTLRAMTWSDYWKYQEEPETP